MDKGLSELRATETDVGKENAHENRGRIKSEYSRPVIP